MKETCQNSYYGGCMETLRRFYLYPSLYGGGGGGGGECRLKLCDFYC